MTQYEAGEGYPRVPSDCWSSRDDRTAEETALDRIRDFIQEYAIRDQTGSQVAYAIEQIMNEEGV